MASAPSADRTLPPASARSRALALNSVWYQKWWIHLRHRPESGGGIVRQILTGFWEYARRPRERQRAQLAGRRGQLQQVRRLLPLPGLPRRLAYPPCLSDRTWRGRRRLHHHAEVLLRRQFRDPEPRRADERRTDPAPVHRLRRRPDHGQRRAEQTGQQRLLRSRHPCRHPLAHRHLLLHSIGRGGGAQHPAGSGGYLCRAVHGQPHKIDGSTATISNQ